MKIASVPTNKRRNIIIIAVLLLGLPLLVYASYQVVQLITRASTEAKPTNVAISNLTTSSATISWVTEISATGSVVPVENNEEQSPVIDKRGSGRRYTHYVEITNLEPNTEYQFTIISEGNKYKSEGSKNFVFKTAPITSDTPTPNPIHGSVSGGNGDDVILFALLKDKSAYPVSSIMPTGGNWIMDISAFRNITDKSMITVSDSTRLVIIAVSGLNKGSVIEGTYSELFDSNGKLKDVYPLNISENSTLYTNFPPVSLFDVYTEEEPEEETPPPSVGEEEEVDEEVVEEEETDRLFRIIQQVQWLDMISGSSTNNTNVGEPSIQVVNLTDTGFTIIWVSQEKQQGYIKYGTSVASLTNEAWDERDGITSKGSYYVHSVSVSRIQPETEYFFEVLSGEEKYDNNGKKYSLKTFATLNSPPPFESVTGVVKEMPEHNEVLVTAYLQDDDQTGSSGKSLKISTLADENGKWILSIADSRTQEGTSYFEYTSGDSIFVDLLSTVASETHTENLEGISDRDIEITMKETSPSTEYTKVVKLDNYGVLGVSASYVVSTEIQESTYEVESSTETPKTGIVENILYLILLALGLIGIGGFLYMRTMTKSRRKGKMGENL